MQKNTDGSYSNVTVDDLQLIVGLATGINGQKKASAEKKGSINGQLISVVPEVSLKVVDGVEFVTFKHKEYDTVTKPVADVLFAKSRIEAKAEPSSFRVVGDERVAFYTFPSRILMQSDKRTPKTALIGENLVFHAAKVLVAAKKTA